MLLELRSGPNDRNPQTPRAEGSAMRILGIDPGIRHTGLCVVLFEGQRRKVLKVTELKGCTVSNVHVPLVQLIMEADVDFVGIEDFHWMGGDKTIGKHSLDLCKLIGAIFSVCYGSTGCEPVLIRKQDCNAAIGVTGKTPKSRIALAVGAIFPGVKMSNEHKRDAAVVALAARTRFSGVKSVSEAVAAVRSADGRGGR